MIRIWRVDCERLLLIPHDGTPWVAERGDHFAAALIAVMIQLPDQAYELV